MTVKDRLISFISYQNIPVSRFESICSLSGGYVKAMRKGLGEGKLNNVLIKFPDLNREWLLFGEGEMLKNSNSPISTSSDMEMLKAKDEIIELLKFKIKSLEDEIINLKK